MLNLAKVVRIDGEPRLKILTLVIISLLSTSANSAYSESGKVSIIE